MLRMIFLPLLGLAGAGFAVFVVAAGSQAAPVAKPIADPSQPPFDLYIAGSGITESMDRNVAIGAPLARLVLEVNVGVGDEVEAGAALFRLDDRDLRAELAVRKAALDSAQAKLAPPDLLGLRLFEWVPCWILSVRLSPVSNRSIQ